jgi:hypothetical protein
VVPKALKASEPEADYYVLVTCLANGFPGAQGLIECAIEHGGLGVGQRELWYQTSESGITVSPNLCSDIEPSSSCG